MSGQGFPFQADAFALARWDYCRIPESVPVTSDQLSCTLRARQCGSHISSTNDKRWLQLAAGPLGSLIEPAVVTGWQGSDGCVDVDATGVCNLMSSTRYGEAFWNSTGRDRSAAADDAVHKSQGGVEPKPPPIEGDTKLTPPVFGSVGWLMGRYM